MNLTTLFRFTGLVFGGIQAIEAIASAAGGRAKQDAVVEHVQTMLPMVDATVGTSLATDKDVTKAIRAVTDAIVAFENLVERKRAAAKAVAS